jgi:acyl-CoA synthetase (AMP-forming)/AMP-acid ligase II
MATVTAAVLKEGSSDVEAVAAQALEQSSLCAAFQLTAVANAERPALRTPDGLVEISWGEYAERVRQIAAGLASLAVGSGDTVALMLTTRPEFHFVGTAAIHLGAAPFSVCPTTPAEKIVPLLEASAARVLVTEAAFLERAHEARHMHAPLEHLVVIDGDGGDHLTLGDVEVRADLRFDFEAAWQAADGLRLHDHRVLRPAPLPVGRPRSPFEASLRGALDAILAGRILGI